MSSEIIAISPAKPLRSSISTAAKPAAPPPMTMNRSSDRVLCRRREGVGRRAGCRTRTKLSSTATSQCGSGSNAGAARGSPERKLKQA